VSAEKYVLIDPVTRVEGEARVVVVVDENDDVVDAYYQIVSGRGFESFCIGRAVEYLPKLTSAVCGVCSWAHHLVSAKAVDEVLGREPPTPAKKIREFTYYMQIIDSHLLHFGYMALPDFLLHEAPVEDKNIVGLLKREPGIASTILKTREYIKAAEKILGGKPVHASLAVPGGVSRCLKQEEISMLESILKDLEKLVDEIAAFFDNKVVKSDVFQKYLSDEAYTLKTYYMGLVGRDNTLEFYDGLLKIIDAEGREVALFKPGEYTEYIAEHSTSWSYSKFPYLRKLGWRGFNEDSVLRVGPLARLNVVDKVPTEKAGGEYREMISFFGKKPVHNTMAYHWARIIETVYSIERMIEMISDPDLTSRDVVNLEGEPRYEGVGVIEAPRGTLIHHYRAGRDLIAAHVNIITPTTFNNTAINVEIKKVARKVLKIGSVDRSTLNRVEMSIRAYDPCNSCAAHYVDLDSNGYWKLVVYRIPSGEKRVVSIKVV